MIALAERVAQASADNELDARREIARQACVNYGKTSINVSSKGWDKNTDNENKILIGYSTTNTRSYKENVTSTFNWETLVCHRCIRKQPCSKMKGKNCRTWGEEHETCNDIQF